MNNSGLPTPPPHSGPSQSQSQSSQSQSQHLPNPPPPANAGSLSVDGIISNILNAPNISTLSSQLKHIPRDVRDTLLAGPTSTGQDPLSFLDLRANTLGVLYILTARLQAGGQAMPSMTLLERFCASFRQEQMRYAADRVTILAKGIVHLAETMDNINYAIKPLYDLLTNYPPSLSYLTTIHPLFISACVASRHFAAALPVLSVPITHVDTQISDLHYNDALIYHYAGGVALAVLKRWRDAEEFFEICASAPGQAPAALQLEALKKLVLVQLIAKGKTTPPPKYTNQMLLRMLKSSPYGAFATHYPQQPEKLRDLVNKDGKTFNHEKNMGLIEQALARAPRWAIARLTATYTTLGLSEIARAVGIGSEEEVRALVVSMIESGEITAQIDALGAVTFSDPPAAFTTADVDRLLHEAQSQGRRLARLEQELAGSKEYLAKAVKSGQDSSWGGGADDDSGLMGAAMGGGWMDDAMFG